MNKVIDKVFTKITKNPYVYEMALILASLFWAVAFIWVKQALDSGLSAQQVLMVRYFVACIIMLPFCLKDLKAMTKQDAWLGLIGGALLCGGMLTQTIALQVTSPSNSAFITTTYVVMVPFLSWIVHKKRPDARVYVCAFLALLGLYILTSKPGQPFTIEPASALTAFSAVIFAVQLIFIGYAGRKMSVKLLTFLPLVVTFIYTTISCAFTGELVVSSTNMAWAIGNVALAAIFATAIAGAFQVIAQRKVDPSRAAIIMSLESLFTCVISVIMGYDALTWSLIIGGIIILVAIILAET